jgi:hypothetical protein
LPSRFRVPAGYVVGALAVLLARPNALSLLLALPVVLGGEALRLWASGHIEKTRRLATGGPYAHTRNPLYLGSVLLALGFATASPARGWSWPRRRTLLAFYPAVIGRRRASCARTFPEEYGLWARDRAALSPADQRRGAAADDLAWSRVSANREWRTAAALPGRLALLWARALAR